MKGLCVGCFKNLGVESRIRIYQFVDAENSKNVSEITKFMGLKQPTVSYHLKEMTSSGLLNRKEIGKQVYYSSSKTCPHDGKQCIIQRK